MFKYYYLRCRSVTYARHAVNILNSQNMFSAVARLPQDLTETGCGYAVKIRTDPEIVLPILQNIGIQILNIYEKIGTEYREVRI